LNFTPYPMPYMEQIDRKKFLHSSVKAAFGTLFIGPVLLQATACGNNSGTVETTDESSETSGTENGTFSLQRIELPYGYDALEPHIDARTMELHYTKHHAGYESKLKAAIEEENINASSDEEFFSRIGNLSKAARNNGGGTWNHN